MSFINDIAFDERLAVLEIEGTLTVGEDTLLQGDSRREHTPTGRVP